MKTGIKIFIAVIGFTAFCAGSCRQENPIKKAEWLTGTWENSTPEGNIYEAWSGTNGSGLSGVSYMLKDKDTIVFENIRLVEEQGTLFYIPAVKDQNNGLPIRFAATTISESQMIFENPQHDFPQVISYTKITADSLVAEISATNNGQVRRETFPMKRVR